MAALLSSFEQPASPNQEGFRSSEEIATMLGDRGAWEKKFRSQVEDLEGKILDIPFLSAGALMLRSDIAHTVLDLLIQFSQNTSASTSPSTPSSPSPHLTGRTQQPTQPSSSLPTPFKAEQLIRLKIAMRETEHPPRPRQPFSTPLFNYSNGTDDTSLGRNEGTVRFLFSPLVASGQGVP